ncbi:hypothetical protein PIB30_070619, partial [Stylosanthes scabra]|nr:hypothetical protein [Stylosanthes scabra]
KLAKLRHDIQSFSQKETNIPFVEALEQMPLYAKFMKDLISKKRSWKRKKPFN